MQPGAPWEEREQEEDPGAVSRPEEGGRSRTWSRRSILSQSIIPREKGGAGGEEGPGAVSQRREGCGRSRR